MEIKELSENIGLEEDEYLEIVELFLETTKTDLEKLGSGIHNDDTHQVVEAAHSIKGASANLGLMEISEVAKKVERKARQNSLEGTAEAVKSIKEGCEQIALSIRLGMSTTC